MSKVKLESLKREKLRTLPWVEAEAVQLSYWKHHHQSPNHHFISQCSAQFFFKHSNRLKVHRENRKGKNLGLWLHGLSYIKIRFIELVSIAFSLSVCFPFVFFQLSVKVQAREGEERTHDDHDCYRNLSIWFLLYSNCISGWLYLRNTRSSSMYGFNIQVNQAFRLLLSLSELNSERVSLNLTNWATSFFPKLYSLFCKCVCVCVVVIGISEDTHTYLYFFLLRILPPLPFPRNYPPPPPPPPTKP